MFIDAHMHLHDIKSDIDRRAILEDALTENVGMFFCNATKPDDYEVVSALAKHYNEIFPFFGVHPWYVDRVDDNWKQQLRVCLNSNPIAGVGEMGLHNSPKRPDIKIQKEFFVAQLEISAEYSRVSTIHCVNAWGDLIEILHDVKLNRPFLIHSYSGSIESAKELLKLGAMFSFSYGALLNHGIKLLDVVKQIPPDRILLETDFPYVPTDTDMDVDDYVFCLLKTYSIMSDLLNIDRDRLKEICANNGQTFKN